MSFKENFNRICREKGTYPTQIVKKLGLSTSKVSRWNEGSLPKEDVMILLARELGCSVMDFFSDEDDLHERQPIPKDEDEEDILRIYSSCRWCMSLRTAKNWRGIVEFLRLSKVVPIELVRRKRALEVILRKR